MNKKIPKEIKQIATTGAQVDIYTKNAKVIKSQLEKLNNIEITIKQALIKDTDYGYIPGVEKPTLFKSGASKICLLFGLRAKYEIIETTNQPSEGMLEYIFKATLLNKNSFGIWEEIAEGFGSANTREKAKQEQIKKSALKTEALRNTILKIAKKRALVDAVLSIGVLSAAFTQDLEELNAMPLKKFEALALYTILYDSFSQIKNNFKDIKDFKELVKNFYKEELYKRVKTPFSIMSFTKEDKKNFLEYLNNNENLEFERLELLKIVEKNYENNK